MCRTVLKATVILLPLLGITWVFGLLAVNQESSVFAWIFAIFNSLQVKQIANNKSKLTCSLNHRDCLFLFFMSSEMTRLKVAMFSQSYCKYICVLSRSGRKFHPVGNR